MKYVDRAWTDGNSFYFIAVMKWATVLCSFLILPTQALIRKPNLNLKDVRKEINQRKPIYLINSGVNYSLYCKTL